jgi:hypothetical protein
VLTITQRMRGHKVVGKTVEFFGAGVDELGLPDRATVSNMTPEYGANMGFFPVDAETLRFLEITGRDPQQIALVETYCKTQVCGVMRTPRFRSIARSSTSTLAKLCRAQPAPSVRINGLTWRDYRQLLMMRIQASVAKKRRLRQRLRTAKRRHRARCYYELHEYSESVFHGCRWLARKKRFSCRSEGKAVDQDLVLAGLAGCLRLPRAERFAATIG